MINGPKVDNSVAALFLVRYCSPNAVSSKYRQIASVDSSPYMKEEDEDYRRSHSNSVV